MTSDFPGAQRDAGGAESLWRRGIASARPSSAADVAMGEQGGVVSSFRGEQRAGGTCDRTSGPREDAAAPSPLVPGDREVPRKGTGVKLVPFFALVLGLIALGLAWSSPASAGTGTCLQTGFETVATDAADYPPGATVRITGTNYSRGLRRRARHFTA